LSAKYRRNIAAFIKGWNDNYGLLASYAGRTVFSGCFTADVSFFLFFFRLLISKIAWPIVTKLCHVRRWRRFINVDQKFVAFSPEICRPKNIKIGVISDNLIAQIFLEHKDISSIYGRTPLTWRLKWAHFGPQTLKIGPQFRPTPNLLVAVSWVLRDDAHENFTVVTEWPRQRILIHCERRTKKRKKKKKSLQHKISVWKFKRERDTLFVAVNFNKNLMILRVPTSSACCLVYQSLSPSFRFVDRSVDSCWSRII